MFSRCTAAQDASGWRGGEMDNRVGAGEAGRLERLAMGGVAFALLMVAELDVSLIFFHRSVSQHLAGYQSVAGAVGLGAQVAFAWVPLALTWRSWNALTVVRAVHTVI